MSAAPYASPDDESGLSLIELLIAALVGGVILAVVATVFVSTLQANASARDRDLATGRVQAISTSLSSAVRNASAVEVAALAGGGSVARATVASGATGWKCEAWAVVDLAGSASRPDGRYELRHLTYGVLASGASAPAPSASWGVLADWVEPIRSVGTDLPFFTKTGAQLTWNLAVSTAVQEQLNERSSAAVTGSAVARGYQSEVTLRC